MDYTRIYKYRFKDVSSQSKNLVWNSLSNFLYKKYLNRPNTVLDPAGGMCEFINTIPAKEKWTIDLNEDFVRKHANQDIKIIIGSNLTVDIPTDYFDAIFVSNFLEHLSSQEEVAIFLNRLYSALKQRGRIAIMGPNFKYCYKDYFDFADHNVILSHLSLSEHLYGAGFNIVKIIPKFLPMSFRSSKILRFGNRQTRNKPILKFMAKLFFCMPIAWKIVGKQFLLIAEKSQK
jgi:hypothetical protein